MLKIQNTVRMSIRVPHETHAKLKEISLRKGQTLQSILHEALMRYIDIEEKKLGIVHDDV